MDYLELSVELTPRDPWAEILVAELAEVGFESFVETEKGVQAYGQVTQVTIEDAINGTFLGSSNVEVTASYSSKIIEHQNWNAVWESDFEPVEVEDYLSILAPFHSKEGKKGMVVEIQPQMSFGTGHHQTTWMMSKALFELNEMPMNVLDMGTGTGVLAIVAENLGAKRILAIDIEDWSVENTIENANRNNAKNIEAKCGDIDLIGEEKFGLIIANINKNVLKAHMPYYANALEKNGILLLSGFFDSDADEMIAFAKPYGLEIEKVLNKDNWAGLKMIKTS